MTAILFFLLASFVYETPGQIFSGYSPEIVMAHSTGEGTYRFSASIETRPGEGCESDTVLYLVRSYVGSRGGPGGQRSEIRIHKKGSAVTGVAEIPASTFRVKAGTRISYHVEYLIDGRCKTRPTYQVFPVLERMED
jgi:hypothetical protein